MLSAIYPSLAEKRVVITGGGSGIGAAIVEAFVQQNSKVFFLDIAEADARVLEEKFSGNENKPEFFLCDLTNVEEVKSTFAAIEKSTGPVNILINNAGNDDRHELNEVTHQYWDGRIAVNLRHQYFCAQAVVPGMRSIGGGVILNLGSIAWHLALPSLSIYMTAKAGIEGLTRGLARDLGEHNIRVNCIVPGAVKTPRQQKLWQTPESEAQIVASQCLKQRIDSEHVAAMALFLASDDAARCSGREYFVDAGWYGV